MVLEGYNSLEFYALDAWYMSVCGVRGKKTKGKAFFMFEPQTDYQSECDLIYSTKVSSKRNQMNLKSRKTFKDIDSVQCLHSAHDTQY